MRRLVACIAVIAASACVPSEAPHTVSASFNPAEVAWFNVPGKNAVHGNAVMRTAGGEARTCAGLSAYLVPVSSYANERFALMYGGASTSGYLSATSGFKWSTTDSAYAAASRQTSCDSLGNFTFSGLPDGDYYVTAQVTWSVWTGYFNSVQGGMLMQRVTLHGGETKDIVLTG